MIFLSSKKWTKCIQNKSFWNCFVKSIFNVKIIKIFLLIAHSDHFQTFPACSFLAFAKDGQCRGDGCMVVSVWQPWFLKPYTKILYGRGPCLYWRWSNVNNCTDHMTTLLSLEMALLSTQEMELQEIGEKLFQASDEKYIRLFSRYIALLLNKRLLSGYCISENYDL